MGFGGYNGRVTIEQKLRNPHYGFRLLSTALSLWVVV